MPLPPGGSHLKLIYIETKEIQLGVQINALQYEQLFNELKKIFNDAYIKY